MGAIEKILSYIILNILPSGVENMYNRWAHRYDLEFQNKRYKAPEKLADKFNNAAKGLRILDVGIGTGLLAERLKAHHPGSHITGIDVSDQMLKECENKNIADKLIQIDFQKEAFPFKDNEFDLVVSSGVFELLKKPDNVIKEMGRVLKPSGDFAFTVFADSSNGYSCRRHPDALIEESLKSGGLVAESREHFNAFKHKCSDINYHLYKGRKHGLANNLTPTS